MEYARGHESAPQLVKALLHEFKYWLILEEDAEVKIVRALQNEIDQTESVPTKAILNSILAETYWQYYQSNRYRFLNRTPLSAITNDDFRTWDLATLFSKIRTQYFLSLEEPIVLQQVPVNNYDAILFEQEESEIYRPTLYDLLAHRAIDFYMNDESSITQPAYRFELENEDDFSSPLAFCKITYHNIIYFGV